MRRVEKTLDVLCVGLAVADVFGKPIDDVPNWGELAVFDAVEHHIGGCAINTAVDLIRLGVRAGLAACIGRDGAGMFVRERLRQEGLELGGLVETEAAATSYTFVMIHSDGRRRYVHHVGANAYFNDKQIADEMLKRARIMHVGGAFLMPALDGEPTTRLLRRARELHVITSMDTAFNPRVDVRALIEPCLRHLDIFFPSIEEAQAITGRNEPQTILDWFEPYSIPLLGVKLGDQGCILRHAGRTWKVPAFQVPVVDASGAGDAFMAGFLYGQLQDWDAERCAMFGNATAAHAIQAMGCSTGIPAAETVQQFLKKQMTHA